MKYFLITALVFAAFWEGKSLDWTRLTLDGPEKISDKVNMIFTPDRQNEIYFPLRDLPFLVSHQAFDETRPTVMYFHGWMESGKLDLSAIAIRGAYEDRGDHNIITVDWSYYSRNINYRTNLIPQLKVISETFAEKLRDFLNAGYSVSKLHLVGLSLGGQMVGKIGRELKKITNGKLVIPRIFALDPAGPGFESHNDIGFEPITRTDGKYVQIIHTCSGRLGMLQRVGSADFYPNGGISQPGCSSDSSASLVNPLSYACDHDRSWHFYQESVRNPKSFSAVRCTSWDDFVFNETCYRDDITNMGFGANVSATGKYFLETNPNQFNLSRGMDGTMYMTINVTRLPSSSDSLDMSIPSGIEEMIGF